MFGPNDSVAKRTPSWARSWADSRRVITSVLTLASVRLPPTGLAHRRDGLTPRPPPDPPLAESAPRGLLGQGFHASVRDIVRDVLALPLAVPECPRGLPGQEGDAVYPLKTSPCAPAGSMTTAMKYRQARPLPPSGAAACGE